jgi:hypothetical protein
VDVTVGFWRYMTILNECAEIEPNSFCTWFTDLQAIVQYCASHHLSIGTHLHYSQALTFHGYMAHHYDHLSGNISNGGGALSQSRTASSLPHSYSLAMPQVTVACLNPPSVLFTVCSLYHLLAIPVKPAKLPLPFWITSLPTIFSVGRSVLTIEVEELLVYMLSLIWFSWT